MQNYLLRTMMTVEHQITFDFNIETCYNLFDGILSVPGVTMPGIRSKVSLSMLAIFSILRILSADACHHLRCNSIGTSSG